MTKNLPGVSAKTGMGVSIGVHYFINDPVYFSTLDFSTFGMNWNTIAFRPTNSAFGTKTSGSEGGLLTRESQLCWIMNAQNNGKLLR